MVYNPDKVFNGIILRKIPFRESSLICSVLSDQFGKISLLAKGVRKPNSKSYGALQILTHLEITAHNKKDSDWFILKSLQQHNIYTSRHFETNIVMQAASELFDQIIVSQDEAKDYYQLLLNFLAYTHKVKKNAIALFWRLLLRIFRLSGIDPDFFVCPVCQDSMEFPFAYSLKNAAFVCENCQRANGDHEYIYLNNSQQNILKILPNIGNYLDELVIDEESANKITRIFLNHLNLHFNNHFKLKSLKIIFPDLSL